MTLRDLRYLLAVAEQGHFGRAAESCGVSQPTLSVQLRKLEAELGVTLFERGGRGVLPTEACARLLPHVQGAVNQADAVLAEAKALRDPLAGGFRLGIIPTLAPYLLPLVFGPLRDALPGLELEPWEDQTAALLDRLRAQELDAVLIATPLERADLVGQTLFAEPFLAALPPDHRLARQEQVSQAELAGDILVLADGHCLRDQALEACGLAMPGGGALRVASLATLLNMVAAGYGTTLVPGLAAGAAQDIGLVLRPLAEPAGRVIRIAWRRGFPRAAAITEVGRIISDKLRGFSEIATV